MRREERKGMGSSEFYRRERRGKGVDEGKTD